MPTEETAADQVPDDATAAPEGAPAEDGTATFDGETALEALSHEECLALLATRDIGRLAVMVGHYPQVFPVNYRIDDFVVVFRTDPGTKLDAAQHRNVAFEVDHFDRDNRTGWSVLVQGMAEDVTDHPPGAVTSRANALQIAPWTGGEKPRFVRVIPARVTGRRLVPRRLADG